MDVHTQYFRKAEGYVCLFSDRGSALADVIFAMSTRLVSNSEMPCLCLLSTEIKGACHHVLPEKRIYIRCDGGWYILATLDLRRKKQVDPCGSLTNQPRLLGEFQRGERACHSKQRECQPRSSTASTCTHALHTHFTHKMRNNDKPITSLNI